MIGGVSMKEIIYNDDDLLESDITEVVVRTKALIINDNNIYLGYADNIYQFPGGHLEANETINECLRREVMEETGIEINDNEISEPFLKIIYMNKDWPEVGKNRKSEIYYYVVKTNKNPDINKASYTESEKKYDFKIETIPLDKAIATIEENISKNEKNIVIARDTIIALRMCLKKYN